MDGHETQGLEFFSGALSFQNLREISRLQAEISRLCSWMSCEGAHQLVGEMGRERRLEGGAALHQAARVAEKDAASTVRRQRRSSSRSRSLKRVPRRVRPSRARRCKEGGGEEGGGEGGGGVLTLTRRSREGGGGEDGAEAKAAQGCEGGRWAVVDARVATARAAKA